MAKKKTTRAAAVPQVATFAVAELAAADYNPRIISDEALAGLTKSIERFGCVEPIVVNVRGQRKRVVGGHQRLKALAALGHAEVLCVTVSCTASEERLLNVTLNNPAIQGEFSDQLDAMLAELTADVGDPALLDLRLDTLRTEIEQTAPDPRDDEVPEPPKKAITKPGDLWLLGDHRLLCGDATHSQCREQVLHGGIPGVMVFDPEWDDIRKIQFDAAGTVLTFGDGGSLGRIVDLFGSPTWLFTWDCSTSWYTPNRPLKRQKLCAWYGRLDAYQFDGAHYGEAGEAKLVSNTRGQYLYRPDPRGKHLSDVFSRPITQEHDGTSHSKPLDWVRCLIGNCSTGAVFDPFCGTGTSLLAAEQLGRRCFGLEIEPKYCDVIVERWQQFTGGKAKRMREAK